MWNTLDFLKKFRTLITSLNFVTTPLTEIECLKFSNFFVS